MPFPRQERRSTPGRIKVRVGELALARGVTNQQGQPNVQAIQEGTELPLMTVWQLVRHPDSRSLIALDTLAALCMFFKCGIGDLLEYDPSGEDTADLPSIDQYIPFEKWEGPKPRKATLEPVGG